MMTLLAKAVLEMSLRMPRTITCLATKLEKKNYLLIPLLFEKTCNFLSLPPTATWDPSLETATEAGPQAASNVETIFPPLTERTLSLQAMTTHPPFAAIATG